jgi:hypothetical protein
MLEPDDGQTAVAEGAPAVGGVQPQSAGNDAPAGTEPPRLPGWTGQLTAEQKAQLESRVAADPAALEKLPKGLTELYAKFSELEAQTVGAIKVPPKDAPKEAWDQFYKGLGRPDSAEAYALEKPQIPAGMRYNEAQEKWFRGMAHAIGLNQAQAQGLFDEFNRQQTAEFQKIMESRQAQRKAERDNAETVLKQRYKDAYLDKMEGMRQAYMALMPGGQNGNLFKKVQALGLDNDPDFLQMWINIAEKIGPPRMVVPSTEGGGSASDRPKPVFKGLEGLNVGRP